MVDLTLIVCPYHVEILRHRVGKGLERILSSLLPKLEQDHSVTVTVKTIEPVDEYEGEIGRSFELIRRISTET